MIAGRVTTMAFERITIDREKMGGLPCIRNVRIPVGTVLGQLAAGREVGEILEDSPTWSKPISWPHWGMPPQRPGA
jgi:uncharacterized protein (DUF433 family)